jgi:hypothetical protein
MSDRPEWFEPKRHGIGAGLPIAWQGWAVLGAFLLAIGAAALVFGPKEPLALAIVNPPLAALLIIAARTTRGGWRWRWGERD